MSEMFPLSDRLRNLIDAYLDGSLDEPGLRELEDALKTDTSARRYFARYSQTHTDLALELAARNAGERALSQIVELPTEPVVLPFRRYGSRPSFRWMMAASLILGMVLGGGVVGLLASTATPKVQPTIQPKTLALDFRSPRPSTLLDAAGLGTGFTHRLPGTGGGLLANDPNWKLSASDGRFELTATASDLNTRFRLEEAEFPGICLSELGFTGKEDFEVAVTLQDIPKMDFVGQFGVYAGTSNNWAIRGGLVSQREPASYRQFAVNTRDGRDKDSYFVGLGNPGDDIRIQLNRTGGKYTMSVENRTSGATSSLSIRHPDFLDGHSDLTVGIFAADPRGMNHKAVHFGAFSATVWTASPARP